MYNRKEAIKILKNYQEVVGKGLSESDKDYVLRLLDKFGLEYSQPKKQRKVKIYQEVVRQLKEKIAEKEAKKVEKEEDNGN